MELSVTPSFSVQLGFICVSLLVSGWWIWAARLAYSSAPAGPATRPTRVSLLSAVIILLWLSSAALVSQQPWAHHFDNFPPPGLRYFLVLLAVTVILAYSKAGKRLALGLPLYLLIGFQLFRIPVELLIHQAYSENITIIEMTYLGRNFDILTGITALLLAVWAWRGAVPRQLLLAWNWAGLLLLLNVVGTGILSMPHPMQLIETSQPNIWITFFPFIWLPSMLVCSALLGHLLLFRRLRHPTID